MKKITSYVFNSGTWESEIILAKAAAFPCCRPSFHRAGYFLVLQFNRHSALPQITLFGFHIKYQIQGRIMSYVKMNLHLEFQYPQVMQIGTYELAQKNPKLWDLNIWSELFCQMRHGISHK